MTAISWPIDAISYSGHWDTKWVSNDDNEQKLFKRRSQSRFSDTWNKNHMWLQ